MTWIASKTKSMYFQLLLLLAAAAATALLVFWGLNSAGEYAVEQHCYDSEYIRTRDQSYVDKLQRYIDRNGLASGDMAILPDWVKEQKLISICIYKDDKILFDSAYPEQEMWEEGVEAYGYEWENYYPITLADGEARVSIWGNYAYQFYNYVMLGALLLSMLVFLAISLLGIRTKMKYISLLSNEIKILESGSLDYEITVRGKDELGILAEGLDSMRMSFRGLIDRETQMMRENQRIVTEMSHDLRTPVTSIMLYTEILKKGKYKSEEQLKSYLEKIERKASRMKQLTDHLFEYSLVTGETPVVLEEPEWFQVLFYDQVSELCSYLEQRGFRMEARLEWPQCKVRVCTDYLARVMDNVASNIVKYADPGDPVTVRTVREEKLVGFSFENALRREGEKAESTGIGIQSIGSMMRKMGGSCHVWQEGEQFRIELLFTAFAE